MAGAALVTGAAGFFGLAIVRALVRAGVPVIATDRADEPAWRDGAAPARYERRDVAVEPLDDLVAEAAGIVHAAALTPADETPGATGDALLAVNLAPLPALLRAARAGAGGRRLILISSAGVFEQTAPRALAEEDADGGSSLYGAAKLAAELVARRYAALYGLEYAAVRPTSLFGAGEVVRPSRTRVTGLAQLVGHAVRGEPVRLEDPGSRADWLCVDDAADAIVALWHAPALEGRAYNLSSARPRPFAEVADAVAAACGLALDPAGTVVRGGPDRGAVISNRRIREALDWAPSRSLEDGARDLAGYLEAVAASR
ncbi:MAG TPA: NAD(P)-dependent oxidoreductase [Solirubrobacteraceae bacterium]|nr:NAD(P)-dependent oxidoreductase [Solirubrobacteraceae bacterium]